MTTATVHQLPVTRIGDEGQDHAADVAALVDEIGRLAGQLDQRRAVVDALVSIRVMPTRKGRPAGWRPGQPYFDPGTIEIRWRRALPQE